MKNRYAIATAFVLCIFIHITLRAAHSDVPENHNSLNNNMPITVSPDISTNINIHMFQEMATSISNSLKNVYETALKAGEKSAESLGTLTEWAGNNKIKLACYITASLYGYITYRLLALKSLLVQPDNWSLWNASVPLGELYAIPEKELGEILIKEAQQRYTVINDPENFITPIITFLQTVEQEKKNLQAYISLCGWIRTVRLEKIFWLDAPLASACEERLKRLAYIRAIFVNWITEYKFTQNAVPVATVTTTVVPAMAVPVITVPAAA